MSSEDQTRDVDFWATLAESIRKLPRRQREAVTLRMVLDMSEADAAKLMGISGTTLRVHIHRSIPALKKRFEDPEGR
jgi:RNA polymerase sigma-70 factor (ECF subfamily)